MGRLVKRMMFDDIYAIGQNENWFSDMAMKGLHLKKFGRIFVYFEKGEPKETKYRIDYIKGSPSQEQFDVYHDCGWDFIANNGDFYVFSADEKFCTTELHTDPIEQGFSLADLNKRLRNNLIIISIAMLLFLGMILSMYFLNNEPFLYIIEGQFVQQMLLVIVELYIFYTVIRNYVNIRKIKKSLLQGKEINHNEDYRKARLLGGIFACLYLPIALYAIFIPFVVASKSKDYTLPEANVNLPIVRLAEIEQNPNLMRKKGYIDNKVDWGNRVSYDWSLLAPVQYEIDERGIINGEMWGDKSGVYSPSISTQYYNLTFSNMADNLTQDLINYYVRLDNIEIKEVNNLELDKLYIAEDDIRKQVFAYLDDQVIFVTYYGKEKIEDIIPLVSEKLLSYKE